MSALTSFNSISTEELLMKPCKILDLRRALLYDLYLDGNITNPRAPYAGAFTAGLQHAQVLGLGHCCGSHSHGPGDAIYEGICE